MIALHHEDLFLWNNVGTQLQLLNFPIPAPSLNSQRAHHNASTSTSGIFSLPPPDLDLTDGHVFYIGAQQESGGGVERGQGERTAETRSGARERERVREVAGEGKKGIICTVLHTPGHTPGSCSFLFEELASRKRMLASGNMLHLSFSSPQFSLLLSPQQHSTSFLQHHHQVILYFVGVWVGLTFLEEIPTSCCSLSNRDSTRYHSIHW